MNLCDAIKEAIRLKSPGVSNSLRGFFFQKRKGKAYRAMVDMNGNPVQVFDLDFTNDGWRPIE